MTTNTLRPDGTINAGGATFTGGAGNWHGNTSDDSDASYATLTPGASASLTSGTFTLDAGNVTKQLRVRVRARADVTAGQFGVSVSSGGVVVASVLALSTTTITTYTGAYVPVTLTQTQIDALTIQPFVQGSGTSGGTTTRFVEIYYDVLETSPPTVTIVAPTGTATVSSPTAVITYTQGSDGGAKTHHQVKVFTDAVFDGGGFNPDTSANIYDSGIVASSSSSIVFGPVVDGVDHHLHVRAAQTINGVQQWSAWDEQIFTIDTNGPDVTSITAVPVAGAGITVTVNRNTGGAAWDHVTVERSADAGATWSFVRGATYDTASGNTYTVTDYEAPNGTSVVYRARGQLTTQVGAWSANSAATSWSSAAIWLKSLGTVTDSQIVTLQAIPDYSISETQTQTYAIQTESTAAATSLETLLGPPRRVGIFHVLGATHPVTVSDAGSTLLLQYPPSHGLTDRYLTVTGYSQGFIATNGQQTIANISLRLFNVETVTVARPADTASS